MDVENGSFGMNEEELSARIGAVSDLHFKRKKNGAWKNNGFNTEDLQGLQSQVDLILVAGDFTDSASRSEAKVAANFFRDCTVPVIGVMGNHDWNIHNPQLVPDILTQVGNVQILNGNVIEVITERELAINVTGVTGYNPNTHQKIMGDNAVDEFTFQKIIKDDLENLEEGIKNLKGGKNIVLLHFPVDPNKYQHRAIQGKKEMTIPRLINKNKRRIDLLVHGHRHSDENRDQYGDVTVTNVATRPVFIALSSGNPYISEI